MLTYLKTRPTCWSTRATTGAFLAFLGAVSAGCSALGGSREARASSVTHHVSGAFKHTYEGTAAWSFRSSGQDVRLEIDGRNVVLRHAIGDDGLRYTEIKHDDGTPDVTFHLSQRPPVRWHGRTLVVSGEVHDLDAAGLYEVTADGAVTYRGQEATSDTN